MHVARGIDMLYRGC